MNKKNIILSLSLFFIFPLYSMEKEHKTNQYPQKNPYQKTYRDGPLTPTRQNPFSSNQNVTTTNRSDETIRERVSSPNPLPTRTVYNSKLYQTDEDFRRDYPEAKNIQASKAPQKPYQQPQGNFYNSQIRITNNNKEDPPKRYPKAKRIQYQEKPLNKSSNNVQNLNGAKKKEGPQNLSKSLPINQQIGHVPSSTSSEKKNKEKKINQNSSNSLQRTSSSCTLDMSQANYGDLTQEKKDVFAYLNSDKFHDNLFSSKSQKKAPYDFELKTITNPRFGSFTNNLNSNSNDSFSEISKKQKPERQKVENGGISDENIHVYDAKKLKIVSPQLKALVLQQQQKSRNLFNLKTEISKLNRVKAHSNEKIKEIEPIIINVETAATIQWAQKLIQASNNEELLAKILNSLAEALLKDPNLKNEYSIQEFIKNLTLKKSPATQKIITNF